MIIYLIVIIINNLLKWIHTESFVHARSVGEKASDGRLEEKTESENVIAHALLEQRITSCFANDQISPLDDHYCNEERRVAGEL